jgi:hypothetical protein
MLRSPIPDAEPDQRTREGTDDLVLEEKLNKATGVVISTLASYAEGWPNDV